MTGFIRISVVLCLMLDVFSCNVLTLKIGNNIKTLNDLENTSKDTRC
jgi:hypothetical protein